MPLWLAVVLLIAALAGIALACQYLKDNRTARILYIVGCGLIILACALYIGLTLLFVDAVQNRPAA